TKEQYRHRFAYLCSRYRRIRRPPGEHHSTHLDTALDENDRRAAVALLNGMQVFQPKTQTKVEHSTSRDRVLWEADLIGRTDADIAYLLQNGYWPEEADRHRPN